MRIYDEAQEVLVSGVFWFEIPVIDLTQAMHFYSKIFNATMTAQEGMGTELAMLPGMNGAIVKGEDYVPSQTGDIIYLDDAPDLNLNLDRVENAGGKVLLPKTGIGENGCAAYFEDTEGNKIGLHSCE